MTAFITVSIVSHGHGALLSSLLEDLSACEEVANIVLTFNMPEPDIVLPTLEVLTLINNDSIKGFGENHNAAFKLSANPYFVVINPDVKLIGNPFPSLLACLREKNVALSAPIVVNSSGIPQDSARAFPTFFSLMLKAFGMGDGRVCCNRDEIPKSVPWVAGMFMLLRSADYKAIDGFDEDYFLYYEDVDLCERLWRSGRQVMLCPSAQIIHDARRASRRDFHHMRWHLASMGRYFYKQFRGRFRKVGGV